MEKAALILAIIWIFAISNLLMIIGDIVTQNFIQGNRTASCGYIVTEANTQSQPACSLKCVLHNNCKGFLFDEQTSLSEKCKIVTTQEATMVNLTEMGQNTQYSLKIPHTVGCKDLGINISTPAEWRSGCPTVYFPLDSANEGTVYGDAAGTAAITFPAGVLNNAFKFDNPNGNRKAGLNLGFYPNTSYCFPAPENCIQGATYSFWMKILPPPGTLPGYYQGFITTVLGAGPGFNVQWNIWDDDSLDFRVLRASDGTRDVAGIGSANWMNHFGFGMFNISPETKSIFLLFKRGNLCITLTIQRNAKS